MDPGPGARWRTQLLTLIRDPAIRAGSGTVKRIHIHLPAFVRGEAVRIQSLASLFKRGMQGSPTGIAQQ